jgi:NADH:ubiquinone oxidoreductase subunit
MIINNNFNKISDLALATTLSLYFQIKNIDSTDKRRICFIFDKNDEVDSLISKYWSDELVIEPKQFFNQLKVIKSRIYSQ